MLDHAYRQFCQLTCVLCDFSVSLYALCKDRGVRHQDCRQKRFVRYTALHLYFNISGTSSGDSQKHVLFAVDCLVDR